VQVHTEDGVSGVMRAQKRAAVQHILCSSWPQLLKSQTVQRLIDELHVPAAWVAEARAWWAATNWDTHTEVRHQVEIAPLLCGTTLVCATQRAAFDLCLKSSWR
jgi:hypothetical protein